MPYLNTEKIVAYVPAGTRKPMYVCRLCGAQRKPLEMKAHLETDHQLKVEWFGYAFYEEGGVQ